MTDADAGAVTGIALSGTDTSHGTWWYSLNNGGTWTAVGTVDNTHALLLAADAGTRLYFQPTAGFSDSVGNAITFHAWDETIGTAGTKVDASANGGITAISAATGTADIQLLDTTPPTLVSEAITSATGIQNKYLNAGDVVSVTVTMSEVVTVTGTPLLALNIGGTTVQASYASGTGSAALVFNYTIQAGQTDTNGISIAANALSLNSGTIKDLAGNAATLTAVAVADNSNYAVDTSAPNAPTGLGHSGSNVSWSAATDNTGGSGIDHYLYQVDSGTRSTPNGTYISTTGLTGSWSNPAGTQNWTLFVESVDVAGNVSSATKSQFTAPAGASGEPINLALTDPSTDHVGAISLTITGVPDRLEPERRHPQRRRQLDGARPTTSARSRSPRLKAIPALWCSTWSESWTNADGTTGTRLCSPTTSKPMPRARRSSPGPATTP